MSSRFRKVSALTLGASVTILFVGAPLASSGCNPGPEAMLRAKVIEERGELIGGPVAAADVGDFLLENDQIKIAILGSRPSPAPGVFGGSIVDADRVRPREGFEGGNGHDRFSETFPVANLLVPNPDGTEVTVVKDGSDGKEAVVRVEGDGDFLYEALALLRDKKDVLGSIFPGVRTSIHFRTDYTLRPGDRHVKMRTVITVKQDDQPSTCNGLGGCAMKCENGFAQDQNGCLVCQCSELLTLDPYAESHSVFGGILGDTPTVAMPPAVKRAGMIAGDFVFFGNQNDVFAPGVGFDEDEAVQSAANQGRNTFTSPLTYDFVAAAGRDISYGYFTGQEGSIVNVPIFASAATAFLVGGKNCDFDTADDAACDQHRAWAYERYFVVGDGDIASVTEEMDKILGRETAEFTGHVYWSSTGEAAPHSTVMLFADPDPKAKFAGIDEIAEANRATRGDVGVMNSIYADVGIDKVEDGDFHGGIEAGTYLVVAIDPTGQSASKPVRVKLEPGKKTDLTIGLPEPAFVDYRVTNELGELMPAKISFVALDAHGEPLDGDGRRRVYAGEGRLNDGQRLQELSASGMGRVRVEPGKYRMYVSRGPEYGIHTEVLELASGTDTRVDAVLPHEVDTTGYLSIDMHIHSAPSFDSGMALPKRVTTVAAEGLDIGVATDHEVATDYEPVIRDLHLEKQLKSYVSAEVTTLEYGHYIGFPMKYDNLDLPRHDAPDWSCLPTAGIIDAIRKAGDDIEPLTIVCHPRDGFFGYMEQSGVDTFTLTRKLSTLNESNPVFRTMTCDFDAMEIMGAKRLDLLRTPTVAEMVDWTRCKARLNASMEETELLASCPEMPDGTLDMCGSDESFDFCKRRNRSRLAYYMTKRMFERTESEQALAFDFAGDQTASQTLCDPNQFGTDPVPDDVKDQPCAYRAGQVDDYFRYLEYGFTPTMIGSSDSHDLQKEPGTPRTYFKSPTDEASGIEPQTVINSIRNGHAVASYGPFLDAAIGDKSFGDTIRTKAGKELELDITVETPTWFGADRVEIYINGHIDRVLESDKGPKEIYDFRKKVPITVPDRDSWIVIAAMGLRDENLMRPVVLDIPYGEIQLSALASGAFADVPVINTILKASPSVPDWSPIIPYAISNPIYLDVNGNGKYDAPNGPPPFCSAPCKSDSDCPTGQKCLDEEKLCGLSIGGGCPVHRQAPGGD